MRTLKIFIICLIAIFIYFGGIQTGIYLERECQKIERKHLFFEKKNLEKKIFQLEKKLRLLDRKLQQLKILEFHLEKLLRDRKGKKEHRNPSPDQQQRLGQPRKIEI